MRRIPTRILRRNRQNSYAEEQAQGYRPAIDAETIPCRNCAHTQIAHEPFGGKCEARGCPCQGFRENTHAA